LSEGELESKLRSLLGLNKYEAETYSALLRLGSGRPADIARESSVPAQRVYDILKSLESMGLVTEADGVYRLVDPRQAMSAIAQAEVLQSLERARALSELGDEIAKAFGSAQGPAVTLIKGLSNVLGAAVSYGSSCSSRPIFMAFKVFDRLPQLLPELRRLVRSLPSGALIIVPRGLLAKYKESAEEFRGYGVEFVESDLAFLDLMVSCNTVIVGLPRGDDAVAVVVNDKDFAEAMYNRLEALLAGRA